MSVVSGVYWTGSNGNTYIKTSTSGGVKDLGRLTPDSPNYDVLNGLQQVNDPNAPVAPSAPAPTDPNGSTGSSTFQDKSNDIAIQNAGLTAADAQKASGLSAVDKALGGLKGQYDTESQTNEGTYGTQSDTNRNNLQGNKESALVNAAQGRQGLFGTLSSLGALNGSGIDLANRAVQKGANDDLSGAEDTFSGNQTGLDTAIQKFRQDDARRRQDADSAAANAKTKVAHDTAVSKQSFLTNLANDYSAEGNTGQAKAYTDQAAALYPEVANNSIPDTNLGYTSAAFTPGALSNYLAGSGNTTVTATPTTGGGTGKSNLPGLFAANDDQKKKQQLATPVAA